MTECTGHCWRVWHMTGGNHRTDCPAYKPFDLKRAAQGWIDGDEYYNEGGLGYVEVIELQKDLIEELERKNKSLKTQLETYRLSK